MQREIRRLERNMVKLRKNRYPKLARTLGESLLMLKSVIDEEKTEHAFTVNQADTKQGKLDHTRHCKGEFCALDGGIADFG